MMAERQGMVPSRDGTRLSYRMYGDPALPPLVLVHGWAQQMMCWDPIISDLQQSFHIVVFDLRGHGGSDVPEDESAYTDTARWAEDLDAMIALLDGARPVLVGWSYGARVIAAYLSVHGADAISGVVLAGGILAIGKARPDWMLGEASPARSRDLYTDDTNRRLKATAGFVEACTTVPLPRLLFAELVGANMLCPAFVRRALFAADVDFRDVFAALPCPGLVIHGTDDQVVPVEVGKRAADLMPNGRYIPYDGIGHAPFLEAPDRFAHDLANFARASRTQVEGDKRDAILRA